MLVSGTCCCWFVHMGREFSKPFSRWDGASSQQWESQLSHSDGADSLEMAKIDFGALPEMCTCEIFWKKQLKEVLCRMMASLVSGLQPKRDPSDAQGREELFCFPPFFLLCTSVRKWVILSCAKSKVIRKAFFLFCPNFRLLNALKCWTPNREHKFPLLTVSSCSDFSCKQRTPALYPLHKQRIRPHVCIFHQSSSTCVRILKYFWQRSVHSSKFFKWSFFFKKNH